MELILPISYQAELRLHYCFGILICPRPQSCWDLIELIMFLLPMAHGHPAVLRELRKLILEHTAKLRAVRSPAPARRGTSHRGRGRGTRRRGPQAESVTESRARRGRLALAATGNDETRTVETIDLVDDGPTVISSSNSQDNNATTRYFPNDVFGGASNGLLPPANSEVNSLVPIQSNTLAEHSRFSSASSSAMIASNHQEEPLAVQNKLDNGQFHISHRKRVFGQTNADEGVFKIPIGVPSTAHNIQSNGQNTRNEISYVTASSDPGSHARRGVLTNSIGVPSTARSFSTNGQNQNVRYQTSNMVVPIVSDVYSQNIALKNSIGLQNTTHSSFQTNCQNVRYQTSNMIAPSVSDAHFRNSALTNSNAIPNTAYNCPTKSQHLRYPDSNMIASSVSDSQAQNSAFANPIGVPSTIQIYPNNSQNLWDQTSNMIAYSVPDLYADNAYKNQSTISNYTVAEHAQNFHNQNNYYRPWSSLDLQMQSGLTTDRRGVLPSSTITSSESLPRMAQNFNPANFSHHNRQNVKLPSFEEAILTLRPRHTNTDAAFNGYNEDNMTLGSGFPNEELNRHAMFAGNQLPNNVHTNVQPSGFYHVRSGTNGAACVTYDSKQQTFQGNNTFASQGFSQNHPHHQAQPYNTNQQALPNDRTQNIQSNRPAVVTNNFKLCTFIKPAEKNDRDIDCVNNPNSSKSINAFTPNNSDEHRAEHTAENSVDLLKDECFFENMSDYEDSNESGLVIDEGEVEEELQGHRGEANADNSLTYPSMADMAS